MAISSKAIQDPDTLRAIAHPLRMALLARLRRDGPATASQLGRVLGESSGSTSYHLRQLERFGFIVEDDVQPSRRERRWKAAHESTEFPPALWDSPAGRELFGTVRRQQLDYLNKGLAAWTEPRRGLGHSDYLLRLDPAELESLTAEIEAVIERFAGHGGSETVSLHVLVLPGDA